MLGDIVVAARQASSHLLSLRRRRRLRQDFAPLCENVHGSNKKRVQ